MSIEPLPKDSKSYVEKAFEAKVRWHKRNARMSFVRKLEVLDRLRERAKTLRELAIVRE